MGKHGYQLLGESVREILVIRIGTDIVERENRQPFPPPLTTLRRFIPGHGNLVDFQWHADVFQRLAAEADEWKVNLVLHVIEDLAGEADIPLLYERLHSGCGVHRVARNVALGVPPP